MCKFEHKKYNPERFNSVARVKLTGCVLRRSCFTLSEFLQCDWDENIYAALCRWRRLLVFDSRVDLHT